MENLDNIKVTVIEKNACTVTSSSVMVGLPTLVGPVGPQGPAGPSGGGEWGTITGDLSDQTDLQNALDLKANTADLGEMAEVDDAPSNDKTYGRKNGNWAEVISNVNWGEITGTLSYQTDLQSTLDGKASSSHNHDDRYYTETEVDTKLRDKLSKYSSETYSQWDTSPLPASTKPVTSGGIYTALDAKANNSMIADEFSQSTTYAVGDYCILIGKLWRFTTAHPAGSWNSSHVVEVLAMDELKALSAQVASRRKFEVSGTASAGSSVTLTDSRINDEHWQVPKNGIWFSDSSKVTTQVHWVTNVTNHTITLEATFTGATNVKVDLDWYQDVQTSS